MRTLFTFTLILAFTISVQSQNSFKKVLYFENNSSAVSVIQTTDGGYAICSHTQDSIIPRILLIKTDPNGDTLWTRTFSGRVSESGEHAIQQSEDGGFVMIASTDTMMYLLKVNSLGDSLWGKRLVEGIPRGIEKTNDGGYIICGDDQWATLIKTDADGVIDWIKYPPARDIMSSSTPLSIRQTSDSGFIFTGVDKTNYFYEFAYLYKVNSLGDSLWYKDIPIYDPVGFSINPVRDDGYFVCGTTGGDAFITQTNLSGDTLWTRVPSYEFGTSTFYVSGSVVSAGGFIVCGAESPASDTAKLLLSKYSDNGELLWTRKFAFYLKSFGWDVIETTDHGFAICGVTYDEPNVHPEIVFIKTTAEGTMMGVENQGSQVLHIFPNPANDILNIDLPDGSKSTTTELIDMMGITKIRAASAPGTTRQTIDLHGLAKGCYIIRVQSEDKSFGMSKVVVE